MDPTDAPVLYEFVMDRWTPSTIPMRRLVQYLEKLSALSGAPDGVHFIKIRSGSAKPSFSVDEYAAADVFSRFVAANDGSLAEAVAIRHQINKMLIEDHCVGTLKVVDGPKVIDFPGRKTPIAEEIVVHESGELDGMVIRVGGRDATVPVQIEGSGTYFRCTTSRTIAKQLAAHLFDGYVRVMGNGKWARGIDGVWEMRAFEIKAFHALDGRTLQAFVEDMRAIAGSGWNESQDAQADLRSLRED